MKAERSSIVEGGGWLAKRIHGRRTARLLFWASLWLCLPAVAGAMGLAFLADAEIPLVLSVFVQVLCWTAIVADAIAWLATLVMSLVERPRDFEMMVENPDYDPKNLY